MAAKTFWDRVARRYIANPVSDVAAYQRKLDLTRAWLTPDTEVLEIGAGSGATARQHAPYVRHIDCIDYSAGMVAHQRAEAEKAGLTNITVTQSSLSDWPQDRRYDVILAMSVLHLLPDRRAGLARIGAMLRLGGIFVSSTACLGAVSPLRPLIALPSALGLLPRVGFFGVEVLLAEMRDAGLTVVSQWQPKARAAHFIVARKPGQGAAVAHSGA